MNPYESTPKNTITNTSTAARNQSGTKTTRVGAGVTAGAAAKAAAAADTDAVAEQRKVARGIEKIRNRIILMRNLGAPGIEVEAEAIPAVKKKRLRVPMKGGQGPRTEHQNTTTGS